MDKSTEIQVNRDKKGIIFDIKRFATGDGPGIRSLVFLKGCPLMCKWCANPESQRTEPEIIYYRNKCTGCNKCVEKCPTQAIKHDQKYGLIIDREKCTTCGKCMEVCYYGARELIGKDMSVSEVMEIIHKDKKYYDNSGGGVTLTGGEPLLQPEFTKELLKACKKSGINTAIETSGSAKWQYLNEILPYLDLIFYDFKHIDSELHRQYTGVDNERILENLRKVNDTFEGEIIVRIPFITDINDSEENQIRMYKHISQFNKIKKIEIMPYHRFGIPKYYGFGRDYKLEDLKPVNKNDLNHLCDLGMIYGMKVQIDSE